MKIMTYDELMSPDIMQAIVPSAHNPVPVTLVDHALMFCAGILTIERQDEAKTPCIVWEIDDDDLDLLDDFYYGTPYERYDTNNGKIFLLTDEVKHIYAIPSNNTILTLVEIYDYWNFVNDSLWNALRDAAKFQSTTLEMQRGVLH